MAVARIRALARKDAQDLAPELEKRSAARLTEVEDDLTAIGEVEAKSLTQLLEAQRTRIAKAESAFDPNQLVLPGIAEAERRQMEADRRHWTQRLQHLERELREEPDRVRGAYTVRAHRLEPVGLVYLWPVSG